MTEKTGGNKKDKALLIVSSGTAHLEAITRCIEPCERMLAGAFPGHDTKRAFTSLPVLKKLKADHDIHFDSVEEALWKIHKDGFSEALIQPLHLIPGEEFHQQIVKNIGKYKEFFDKIYCGKPLLSDMDDYLKVLDAIKYQIPDFKKDEALLFMGHGTKHPANAAYSCMQMMIEDAGLPVYIGTMGCYPDLDEVIPKLRKSGVKSVILMPFMLTAGGHAFYDMAGDGKDSWKSTLGREGFSVKVDLRGLGENPLIQEIFVQHAMDALIAGAA